jgi:uncharacterized protein YqjF (DUF2071 family)
MPASALAALLPRELTIDTFEGRAYVGVVPFTMRDVRVAWAPPVPTARHFHELNVRTYVHYQGRDPGVWFFSLDAASSLAVIGARAGFHLPYYRATMDLDMTGAQVHYRSRRRWPGPKPAEFQASYTIGDPIGAAELGSLEYFLAERYILYAQPKKGKLLLGKVHHTPYPLHHATVSEMRESMVRAAGLPDPQGAPHLLYSPGVDVEIFALGAIS